MSVRDRVLAAFFLVALPSLGCTKILGIDKDYVETTSKGVTTTGQGGSTSTGSTTGGSGGELPQIPCNTPTDCPGAENECAHRTCEGGLCGVDLTPQGTALSAQNTGDCKKIVCDGRGVPEQQDDDGDVPDDSNPCTNDLCTAGIPGHAPAAFGLTCGTNLSCDGSGNCAGCTSPGDCPGQDTDCQNRACTSGICGFVYSPAGTPVTAQTAGDCKLNVCNGMGQVSVIAASSDPADDGNVCTIDGCSNGSPTHSNTAAGAPCGSGSNNQVCDGGGSCVECLVPASCPGQDDECRTRTCNAGQCGATFAPQGTMVVLQSSGDCRKNVCDGAGAVTSVPDNNDAPDDGNLCTNDSCQNGAPKFDPVAQGTTCGSMKTCNGSGQCVGCIKAVDCPGQDNSCQSRTCTNGVCGMTYVPNGTQVGSQTAGDCKANVCNGSGSTVTVADKFDLPVDGNPCTSDVCSSGVPSNPPAAAGTACTGGVCNGAGACGVCVPGDFQLCCAGNSTGCCFEQPKGDEPSPDGASSTNEVPDIPCCCEGTKDCQANGQWSGCY